MNKKTSLFFPLCFFICGAIHVNAQSGTVVSGGEATGTNGKVSYSVGQTDYKAVAGNDGVVTQGVQQPYEIVTITGIKQTGIQLTASVYPNPTVNFVTLSFADKDLKNTEYSLFDSKGKIISSQAVNSQQTNISMSGLATGTYFIKVLTNKTESKTFKIIKNS